jgi:arabinan endo-1,5-alpha-L-arabinosidase
MARVTVLTRIVCHRTVSSFTQYFMKCPTWVRPGLLAFTLPLFALVLASCGSTDPSQFDPKLQYASMSASLPDPLANYTMTGDVAPTRDPSVIHLGNMYYIFGTDTDAALTGNHLPIRCSTDAINWQSCGYVFADRPQWIKNQYSGIPDLWAPDISYFNGLYHVYYAVSIWGSNDTGMGLATNSTLDPSDPNYEWVDQGEILSSKGDPTGMNAIDPNIFIDDDGRIWLSYGSYGPGIFQQEIDPATGRPVPGGTIYHLAERPGIPSEPLEAASIIHHGQYYYLFASADFCCESNPADSDYKEVMGRSTSVHGPFVSMEGNPMLQGYSTVLLSKDANWGSAGGGTAYIDPKNGDTMIAFHAFNKQANYNVQLWVKHFTWVNDWPLLL